jgi:arsenate reductase
MERQVTLGFVCVQNAGRSQMAAAFARRERERRGLGETVEILTGGTRPAAEIHRAVIEVTQEAGLDVSDREPRAVSTAELDECDVVATMGCSTLDLDAGVETRDWALQDPHGEDTAEVRRIRDEVERLVADLFDERFGEA